MAKQSARGLSNSKEGWKGLNSKDPPKQTSL
jgi:hypothetical protein